MAIEQQHFLSYLGRRKVKGLEVIGLIIEKPDMGRSLGGISGKGMGCFAFGMGAIKFYHLFNDAFARGLLGVDYPRKFKHSIQPAASVLKSWD